MLGRSLVAFLVVALIWAALPAGVWTAAQEPAAGLDPAAVTLTENDCSFLVVLGEDPRPALGDIACGTLEVPENWSVPEGRRIKIGYVVLESTSPDPLPDPLVYLEGGPGSSALLRPATFAEAFAGFRAERDVVLFDQRGTAFSSPLRCSALTIDDLFGGPDTTDEAATPAPEPLAQTAPLDPAAIMAEARAAVGGPIGLCVQQLAAAGIDLRQYNSIASANDTVALIKALGYDTYNLYGISYGTRLALVIMRDHPASGIRSVVLDSTFPPEINGFEQYPSESHEVVIQLFADCALDPVCNEAYPDLKRRFVAVLARLEAEPLALDDGTLVTARDVVQLMQGLSFQVRAVPYVPLMIHQLEQGNPEIYRGIVSGSLFDDPAATGDDAATPEAVDGDELIEASQIALAELAPHIGAQDDELLSPARLFLSDIQLRLSALPAEAGDEALVLLLHLDKLPRTRATLEEFVRRVFDAPAPAADRAALLAIIGMMSEADMHEVFLILGDGFDLIDVLTLQSNANQFHSVECNEEIPFERFENTVARVELLEIPELGEGYAESTARQFATCEIWPSGRAPDVESRPVASDVLTLVLAGSYDFQTPVSWNKLAFVNLANGTFVEFPMSGHGVIAFSACAGEVAQAFVDQPIITPDASCVADLRPDWVLPPAAGDADAAAAATPVAVAAGQ